MEHLTQPNLGTFLLQALLLPIYIPLSYLAYIVALVPQKSDQIQESLGKLGVKKKKGTLREQYELKHYAWPLLLAYILTFIIYTTTHPYVIQHGWWAGILEETIDIFGPENPFPRAIAAGRFLFWGWMGAYIYSVSLTFQRFLHFDLTPSVYFFAATRFFLAMTVGAIVGVGLGTLLTSSGVSFNSALMMVSITSFVIGFFPQLGLSWITSFAKKLLKSEEQISKDMPLSEIKGLTFWQQGRLNQIGIESVDNLASADIPDLIIHTPYRINQVIGWVDQAILRLHTTEDEFKNLNEVSAWCILEHSRIHGGLKNLAEATEIKECRLIQLSRSIRSHNNIVMIMRFHLKKNKAISEMEKAFQEGKVIPDEERLADNTEEPAHTSSVQPIEFDELVKSKNSIDILQNGDETGYLDNKREDVQANEKPKKSLQEVNSLVGKQIDGYNLTKLVKESKREGVYYGYDIRNQPVIMRVINPFFFSDSNEKDIRGCFNQEGKAIASLKHPNIPRYEYGEIDHFLYLVRQYIEGDNLDTAIKICVQHQKSVPHFISRVLREVCQALDYAHSQGVLHRNITTSNIIVNQEGPITLVDFGFTLLTGIQNQNEVLSSPYYISPEQIVPPAKAVSESDFYSLGIILYKIFTGHFPFEIGESSDIAEQHITELPLSPSIFNSNITTDIENIILKALEKRPEDRFHSGIDFANTLERAIQNMLVKA